jgi:hypothetical protein
MKLKKKNKTKHELKLRGKKIKQTQVNLLNLG